MKFIVIGFRFLLFVILILSLIKNEWFYMEIDQYHESLKFGIFGHCKLDKCEIYHDKTSILFINNIFNLTKYAFLFP